MKVEDVMTKNIWTCRAGEAMSCAAWLMWEHDIGAVPVVGEDHKLVGIVTDRDLCMAAYFTGQAMSAVPVAHAMSKVVFTVEPGQDLEAAEKLMDEKQIRRLPVLDADEAVVGMITLGDLARASKARRQVTASEVSATLAAVVQPRVTSVAAP
jgi:CBS domain-containing protein